MSSTSVAGGIFQIGTDLHVLALLSNGLHQAGKDVREYTARDRNLQRSEQMKCWNKYSSRAVER